MFVTGSGTAGSVYFGGYLTVAYDAATGASLWERHYGLDGDSFAKAVAVSPDGATVYVAGTAWMPGTGFDYATVAYSAATGSQLWASSYNGTGGSGDFASSAAVSPATGTVFVTGTSGAASPQGPRDRDRGLSGLSTGGPR